MTFAGDRRGLEGRLVPEAGYPLLELPARPWVGKGFCARLGALGQLVRSTLRARRHVSRLGVDVVLATGGYASVPAALGGRLAGRPLVLLEPNVEPGAANRWLSRFAREACVVEPEVAQFLHCPVVSTGVPIRAAFPATPPPLPWKPPVLLVLGGSQGARQLNELVPEAVAKLAQTGIEQLHVVHQAGSRHEQTVRERWQQNELPNRWSFEVHGFLPDVPRRLLEATLVVSRAGAVTLAEIAAAGRPSLLIPLDLAGGHQRINAARFARLGAARVLDNTQLSANALAAELGALLGNAAQLEAMAKAAYGFARIDAASEVSRRLAAVAAEGQRP